MTYGHEYGEHDYAVIAEAIEAACVCDRAKRPYPWCEASLHDAAAHYLAVAQEGAIRDQCWFWCMHACVGVH